jgi:hypothetical protein
MRKRCFNRAIEFNVFEIYISVSPTFETFHASTEKFRQSRCSYILVLRFWKTHTAGERTSRHVSRVLTDSSALIRLLGGEARKYALDFGRDEHRVDI